MASRNIGIAVVATLLMAGTAIAANDSTSVEEVDVPWQPPSYAATAGSANTAGYANNAGQLGGKGESQLNVAAAGVATYVPSTGVTGLPTCSAGYVLQKTAIGFLCVNTISNASVANSANYSTAAGNGVAGISGSNLNLSNGSSYTLPSGGGGGGGPTGACSYTGTTWDHDDASNHFACWGTARLTGGGGFLGPETFRCSDSGKTSSSGLGGINCP